MEKLAQGKRAILTIFEVLNARYAGELKKDIDKDIKFLYSKFSPLADCITQKDKIYLKDILSIVQTNLIKMYVELREKEKIYQFFSTNQKQIFIDDTDLAQHLQRGKDEPINNTTLALLYEYMDKVIDALKIWQ